MLRSIILEDPATADDVPPEGPDEVAPTDPKDPLPDDAAEPGIPTKDPSPEPDYFPDDTSSRTILR